MCDPLSTHKPPWETRRIDAGKVGKEEADLKDEFRMKALIIKKLMPRSKKKKERKENQIQQGFRVLGAQIKYKRSAKPEGSPEAQRQ